MLGWQRCGFRRKGEWCSEVGRGSWMRSPSLSALRYLPRVHCTPAQNVSLLAILTHNFLSLRTQLLDLVQPLSIPTFLVVLTVHLTVFLLIFYWNTWKFNGIIRIVAAFLVLDELRVIYLRIPSLKIIIVIAATFIDIFMIEILFGRLGSAHPRVSLTERNSWLFRREIRVELAVWMLLVGWHARKQVARGQCALLLRMPVSLRHFYRLTLLALITNLSLRELPAENIA